MLKLLTTLILYAASWLFFVLSVSHDKVYSLWKNVPIFIGTFLIMGYFVILHIVNSNYKKGVVKKYRLIFKRLYKAIILYSACVYGLGVLFFQVQNGKDGITVSTAQLKQMILNEESDLILENQMVLQGLEPSVFILKSVEEKRELLGYVVAIEAENLGIAVPEINIITLEKGLYGYANISQNIIYMSDVNMDNIVPLLETICHEMYHIYQGEAIDTFMEFCEGSNLLWAKELRVWAEEFSNRIPMVPSNEAYAEYYTQKIEQSAREYSRKRMYAYDNVVSILEKQ